MKVEHIECNINSNSFSPCQLNCLKISKPTFALCIQLKKIKRQKTKKTIEIYRGEIFAWNIYLDNIYILCIDI